MFLAMLKAVHKVDFRVRARNRRTPFFRVGSWVVGPSVFVLQSDEP